MNDSKLKGVHAVIDSQSVERLIDGRLKEHSYRKSQRKSVLDSEHLWVRKSLETRTLFGTVAGISFELTYLQIGNHIGQNLTRSN